MNFGTQTLVHGQPNLTLSGIGYDDDDSFPELALLFVILWIFISSINSQTAGMAGLRKLKCFPLPQNTNISFFPSSYNLWLSVFSSLSSPMEVISFRFHLLKLQYYPKLIPWLSNSFNTMQVCIPPKEKTRFWGSEERWFSVKSHWKTKETANLGTYFRLEESFFDYLHFNAALRI